MAGRGRGSIKNRISNDPNENEKLASMVQQMLSLAGPRGSLTEVEEIKDDTVAPNDSPPVSNSPLLDLSHRKLYNNICEKINAMDFNREENEVEEQRQEVIDFYAQECKTDEEVGQAFEVIFQEALHNAEFATKLVNMLSLKSLRGTQIHNTKIFKLFIKRLQAVFEDCKNLQSKNPSAFRNVVRLHGNFFNKANFSSSFLIHVVSPLLQYWDMLLESGQEEDLELFASQLYLNGNLVKELLPEKLKDLLLHIRNVLANDHRLSAVSKIWLLLALDVAWFRFGILPNDLQQFYASQLGEEAMAYFQRANPELTVTIQKNNILDKITSNVNVLSTDNSQSPNYIGNMAKMGGGDSFASPINDSNSGNNSSVSEVVNVGFSKPGYENHDGPKPSFRREKYLVKALTYKKISPNDAAMENIGVWNANANVKKGGANTPRPILGVGWQRKKSGSNSNETDANWRERNTGDGSGDWRESPKSKLNPAAAGWENKPKSTVGSGWDPNSSSNQKPDKKSWSQHDDRTENDYTAK